MNPPTTPRSDPPVHRVEDSDSGINPTCKGAAAPVQKRTGLHGVEQPTLVLGCHHKTGSVLLIQLLERLGPRLIQQRRLKNIVSGSPLDRKAPLSAVLNHHQNPGCYVNLWFEHEIDVPAEDIRLVHFVRHPVKWIRSAYLYHKRGAPADLIRWLDWRVFRLKDQWLSYCELLNRLDTRLGLAIEAIRSFPEIIGTARVARTSCRLKYRHQLSLEKMHDGFDETIQRLCSFIGFNKPETQTLVGQLKHLDLSLLSPGTLPGNVTRNSIEAPPLEDVLKDDPLFAKLFAQAADDMGFPLLGRDVRQNSIFPEAIVTGLLDGTAHFTRSWQTAERMEGFMKDPDESRWWSAYALQVAGCGHLMMQSVLQELLNTAA